MSPFNLLFFIRMFLVLSLNETNLKKPETNPQPQEIQKPHFKIDITEVFINKGFISNIELKYELFARQRMQAIMIWQMDLSLCASKKKKHIPILYPTYIPI